ncbi:cyclin-like protein [Panaeolus papilionaceus]|nr:cyclin-like protein [Panaeolus papilionaceus]
MATDFWASSHYKRWIVDRSSWNQARAEDYRLVDQPEYIDYLSIYFANAINKLGKKLQFRQRVIATATIFFRRFYLKNSYCDTDPFTVIAACCYVAAKAEESPVHIKLVVTESRTLFGREFFTENYGVQHFSSDNSKLAEMEFYLVGDLECDLIVFHPYRTLLALCRKESGGSSQLSSEEGEADDRMGVGIGAEDGPRYWGTGEGQLELAPAAFQTAWSIINDTYRSPLCIFYPPHLIAIAAIYLTFILHPPIKPDSTGTTSEQESLFSESSSEQPRQPRRSSRQAHSTGSQSAMSAQQAKKPQDPIAFFADLNVSLPLIATISQEIISLYTLWDNYKEDGVPDATRLSGNMDSPMSSGMASTSVSPAKRTASGQITRNDSSASNIGMYHRTPASASADGNTCPYITPAFLAGVLKKMREKKMASYAAAASAQSRMQGVAVNKRLERTQAAG